MTKADSRLVYSTEQGQICTDCGHPKKTGTCKKTKFRSPPEIKPDGIIRIKRETKGRGGKTVTTISGLDGNADVLKKLASKLKNLCGSGGSVKDGVILVQGDHRDVIKAELENQGYKAKLIQ
jgi:translation initiation factor 1